MATYDEILKSITDQVKDQSPEMLKVAAKAKKERPGIDVLVDKILQDQLKRNSGN